MQDAVAYMEKVNEVFADRPEVYTEFLSIIKAFQEQRLDTPGVIAAVGKLFAGHDDLLVGFNPFLPEGHRMPVPGREGKASAYGLEKLGGALGHAPPPPGMSPQSGPKPLQMTDAMKYMDKVRDTFSGSPEVYLEFLEIMKSFQSQR